MVEKIFETYRGKTVFITGHTGFKGAWMLQLLHMMGAKIIGYALAPDEAHPLYSKINGDSLCEKSYFEDILNRKLLEEKITQHKPDFIFHLAAQPLVLNSYENPVYTFNTNVMGTIHVLEAMRITDIESIGIIITTDKVYENKELNYAYKEDDKYGGYDPYSGSKAACEIAISSYINSYFSNELSKIKIGIGRAGNVIGGGDMATNRIIPDIVRYTLHNQKLAIRYPDSIRPWQHVLEPIWGYLVLGYHIKNSNKIENWAYNFGPEIEDTLKVKEVVEEFLKHVSHRNEIQYGESQPEKHEASLLQLNINKAKNELNWKPLLSAKTSIKWTADWYFDPTSDILKCQSQINQYLNLVDAN